MTSATDLRGADRPLLGALLIVFAMTILGLTDNCVRVIARDLGLWQFHFVRGLATIPALLIVAGLVPGLSMLARSRFWVSLRSALAVSAILLYFAAIPQMPIAQASAGLFTSPLFVLLFSALLLGEPVGPRRIFAVLLGFAGALLILDPFSLGGGAATVGPGWIAILPVCAGALYALSIIVTRARCRNESTMALTVSNYLFFTLAGAAGVIVMGLWRAPDALSASAPFLFRSWGAFTPDSAALTAAMSIGAVFSILALSKAYRIAQSSFLALFDYSYLIAASGFAYLLWREAPALSTWAGVALIVGAGVYLALRRDHAPALRSPAAGAAQYASPPER